MLPSLFPHHILQVRGHTLLLHFYFLKYDNQYCSRPFLKRKLVASDPKAITHNSSFKAAQRAKARSHVPILGIMHPLLHFWCIVKQNFFMLLKTLQLETIYAYHNYAVFQQTQHTTNCSKKCLLSLLHTKQSLVSEHL